MVKIKIGNIDIKGKAFLAPMAGVTDMTFRRICKIMGAGLVVTEMVSAKSLYYNDKKAESLTKVHKDESPIALQIFGTDAELLARVIKERINSRKDIDIIDINMGCPVPKLVKKGAGSALMREPKKVRYILNQLVQVSEKPITVKIRIGWDKASLNAVEIAKIAEEAGVDGITVHGRTRDMLYSGRADWTYIAKIKESVSIPVVGNGDVFTPDDGIRLLKETGCDAVAIGRGALGNPWIFKGINSILEGKSYYQPTEREIIDMAIKHLNMACRDKGERIAIRQMKKHLLAYVDRLEAGDRIRARVSRGESKREIENIFKAY